MSKGAYNKQNVQNARRTKRMVFQKEANAMYLQIVRRQGPLGHPLGLLPRPSLLWLLLRRQLPALLGGRFGTAGVGHRHGHGHRRPLPVLVGNVLILHHGRQPGSSHDHAVVRHTCRVIDIISPAQKLKNLEICPERPPRAVIGAVEGQAPDQTSVQALEAFLAYSPR